MGSLSIDARPCYGLLCFLISPNRMVLLRSIESGLVDYNCGEPTVCLPVSLFSSLGSHTGWPVILSARREGWGWGHE